MKRLGLGIETLHPFMFFPLFPDWNIILFIPILYKMISAINQGDKFENVKIKLAVSISMK